MMSFDILNGAAITTETICHLVFLNRKTVYKRKTVYMVSQILELYLNLKCFRNTRYWICEGSTTWLVLKGSGKFRRRRKTLSLILSVDKIRNRNTFAFKFFVIEWMRLLEILFFFTGICDEQNFMVDNSSYIDLRILVEGIYREIDWKREGICCFSIGKSFYVYHLKVIDWR